LIFDKGRKAIQQKKKVFSINEARTAKPPCGKKMNQDLPHKNEFEMDH